MRNADTKRENNRMCDHDDFNIDDIADAFGFFETQIEGERDEDGPGDPSVEDTLKTDLDYLDDE